MTKLYRQSLVAYGQPLCETVVDCPAPRGSEVLVRVERCGVCHSDLHLQDGYFALGANKRLDVFSANNTPHLADAGNSPGQIWTITAWGDGTWQLSNQETGNGLYLDVYSDTHAPFLDGGDHTGQHWIFTPLQTTTSPSQNNSTPLPNPSLPLQSSPPHK